MGCFVITASTRAVAVTCGKMSSRVAVTTTHSGPGPGRSTPTVYDPSVSVRPVPATDAGSAPSRQAPELRRTSTDTGALGPDTVPKITMLADDREAAERVRTRWPELGTLV